MNLRVPEEAPIRDSHLKFLLPSPQSVINRSSNNSSSLYNLQDQIFLRGLNKSHIGHISGRKQIKQLDYDFILPSIPETESKFYKKRIDFSNFNGDATSKIYKPTQSHIVFTPKMKGNIGVNQVGGATKIKETPTKQITKVASDECYQEQTLVLLSFTGKDKKEVLYGSGCVICSNVGSQRCKLVLSNQSTLQIYMAGESKESQYNKLIFCVNFDTVTVDIKFSLSIETQLAISVGQCNLLLEHNNPAVINHRLTQLKQMKLQSKGTELQLTKLLSVDQFYLKRYETQQFFTKNCMTGDIILFEDTHFFAKAQRFFTRSDFDHVAVVIKDQQYGLLLFQSTSGGVSLTPWRSIIRYGWYTNIPRIVWRRLKTDKNTAFFDTVEKFVKENIEKSYHISFAKITSHQSVIHKGANKDNLKQQEVEEGFFCSELVATLYKELGLLTRDTNNPNYQPACKFYPKDFSVKSERKLDIGQLSHEYDIFFDKQLLKLTYKTLIHD